MITRCDNCYDDLDETLDIAKFAVEEITGDWRFKDSNEWALQHIAKTNTQVRSSISEIDINCRLL